MTKLYKPLLATHSGLIELSASASDQDDDGKKQKRFWVYLHFDGQIVMELTVTKRSQLKVKDGQRITKGDTILMLPEDKQPDSSMLNQMIVMVADKETVDFMCIQFYENALLSQKHLDELERAGVALYPALYFANLMNSDTLESKQYNFLFAFAELGTSYGKNNLY